MTSVMKVCGIILLYYSPYTLMTCLCCNLCALVRVCFEYNVGPRESWIVFMCRGVSHKKTLKNTRLLLPTGGGIKRKKKEYLVSCQL